MTLPLPARPLAAAALAGLLSLAGATQASAWTRTGTVTTPGGTYTGSVSGGCAYGTCARTKTVTGPNGNTVSRTGTVSRAYPYPTYPYGYTATRTTVGPYGGAVTRSRTVVVTP